MSDYTPTTDDIRHEYAVSFVAEYQQAGREAFDAWLAAHDAALIEGLADGIRHRQHAESIRQWLREKARLRREEQS